jgi:hypothetical protein
MCDGHNEAVDDTAGEVNGSRLGRNHDGAGACSQVDASVTGGVVVDRLLPRTDDDVGIGEWPPPGARHGYGGHEDRHGQGRRAERPREASEQPGHGRMGANVVHDAQPVKGSVRYGRNLPSGGGFVPRSKC